MTYDEGFEKTRAKSSINIIENPRCEDLKRAAEARKNPVKVVVEQPPVEPTQPEPPTKSRLRSALEVLLLVLVGLLVIVGLLIGFSRLKGQSEEEF